MMLVIIVFTTEQEDYISSIFKFKLKKRKNNEGHLSALIKSFYIFISSCNLCENAYNLTINTFSFAF
jgi:hypothetical protein